MEKEKIDAIIDRVGGDARWVIQVLMEIQHENRWLPREALERVSRRLDVPLSEILHIVTFYKTFSLMPRGRHEIHVCTGSSCHVRGSGRLLERVRDLTGIGPGETGPDARFSLETGNCLGSCAWGPEILVDGKHHGRIAPGDVEALLKDCD
ncbi:MAG: NAD(P)H-dependent oxidoreductase subunit E [Thermodesulfobacteriota bacterium]